MSLLSYVERTFYFFSMWLRWSAFATCFVLIVVSLDRCGLSLFYFPVSWETSRFFLFFSPLCVASPGKKCVSVGRDCSVRLQCWTCGKQRMERQRGRRDKSVRGPAQFYPSTAPKQRQIILSNTKAKSTAFERRLCSCRRNAPKRKLTNTLLRRVMDTTAMSAPGTDSA